MQAHPTAFTALLTDDNYETPSHEDMINNGSHMSYNNMIINEEHGGHDVINGDLINNDGDFDLDAFDDLLNNILSDIPDNNSPGVHANNIHGMPANNNHGVHAQGNLNVPPNNIPGGPVRIPYFTRVLDVPLTSAARANRDEYYRAYEAGIIIWQVLSAFPATFDMDAMFTYIVSNSVIFRDDFNICPCCNIRLRSKGKAFCNRRVCRTIGNNFANI